MNGLTVSASRTTPWVVALALMLAWGGSAQAQQPVYIEPLDIEVYDADGNLTPGPHSTRWKPICGSAPDSLTVEDLQELAETVRQIEATLEPQIMTSSGLQAERTASGGGGPTINFIMFGVPAAAQTALGEVAAYIEDEFDDNVTMNINVFWQNLGGGTLGSTGSNETTQSYTTVRNMLQGDMDDSDAIQTYFPSGTTIPVRYNEDSAAVSNETQIIVTLANWKAIGGGAGLTVANMTFNSTVNWDFDPSNGVPITQWDFQSVAVHEVGHAMGFISEADNPAAGNITLLDAYRFRDDDGCCDYNPDTLAEFGTTPRLVDFNNPNDGSIYDMISNEWDMADGSPDQASHWREDAPNIGIMDPAQANGETFWPNFFKVSDQNAFDAIGWDHPVEDAVAALPLVDDFEAAVLDPARWSGVDGATTSTRGINEPSPTRSMNLNGDYLGGDRARTAIMDTSGVSDLVLRYFYEAQGIDDPPEVGDDLIVEYLNSSGTWVLVNTHLATGGGMPDYVQVTVPLPANAMHSQFRVQFRMLSEELIPDDDWFVDDLCIGSAADCALGCSAPEDCLGFTNPCTLTECIAEECVETPVAGPCDDGDACTENDSCTAGECLGSAVDCNDGIACTGDSCDFELGCMHNPVDSLCDDDNPCTDDSCSVDSGCVHTPNDVCGGVEVGVSDNSSVCSEPGVTLCNVHVHMPDAEDRLLSIGFVDISTDDPDGFFQVPALMGGADTAPQDVLIGLFPELVCDSFVTIGLQSVPVGGEDGTTTDPSFDSVAFNDNGQMLGGWFNSNPPNEQGDAGNYPGNNVLIAQLSYGTGFTVVGDVVIFINDGMTEIPGSFECVFATCPADLNGDGIVNAADLALLLGAWGPNPGHPADFNADGVVNAADLALLLGSWGPC